MLALGSVKANGLLRAGPLSTPIVMGRKFRGFRGLTQHTGRVNDSAFSGNRNPAVQAVIR
jgi:hypothetical protein